MKQRVLKYIIWQYQPANIKYQTIHTFTILERHARFNLISSLFLSQKLCRGSSQWANGIILYLIVRKNMHVFSYHASFPFCSFPSSSQTQDFQLVNKVSPAVPLVVQIFIEGGKSISVHLNAFRQDLFSSGFLL